ncbi:carboxypeptidase regulatory-like domain-containing protein [Dactylosporangium vinaceum]|uniref:Carboxypeptidase regulatory-like domain-containing protein n=1 Tax=Dactylosporangium vinaceum TaxID=53362 RepID=A0ABV5LZD5_9ACTN|nr:carboxypeptidase regulatory-like domain-containing protein [Dactylosporangium vinaceum]UAB92566.1 carboxypeptidase regulatory-like domain-containing protein [Dactylosporangium vinaceum]
MQPGVTTAATEELLGWARAAGVTAGSGPPVAEGAQVYLWLLGLLPEQQLRPGDGAAAVRLRLRYLCCCSRPDDLLSLDRMLQATVGSPYPATFEPVPAEIWLSAGLTPRPAFHIDVVARLDRPLRPVPRVVEPLRLQTAPMTTLRGTVLGPGGHALAGMRVETADGRLAADTDHAGRFALPGVVTGRPVALRLTGRGRHFHHEVAADGSPAVIFCEFRED